uniref:YeeE/YedE family protein n=1 Tax=uncultured bacterium UPO76 TaxID=1776993 RepID=A0A140E007_9BACT|nr:YeeE/YedE family protein [uncultured bacterium UPO76]
METTFTPGAGVLGGLLIGLASAGLLLANGKIAGISGILGGSLFARAGDLGWRLAFLIGLPLGAWLATRATSDLHGFSITSSPMLLIAGGALVGVGTQLGSGCTSGHGVCGIARGSRRSIVATFAFMAAAGVTVFVVRHVLGSTT